MSSELAAIDWLGHGWLLLLAFSAAVLLAAALRRPCRRWFGTERAFQLWLLPPLAMLASQCTSRPMPVAVMAGGACARSWPVPCSGSIRWLGGRSPRCATIRNWPAMRPCCANPEPAGARMRMRC